MNVGVAHSEVNPNTRIMNSRGIWLTYALGVGMLHIVLLSIPFFSVPVVWTLTNVIHNLGMYVFLHAVKGTPFETPDQGKARLLTHWEQLDYGVQFTSSRKFFTISPIILYTEFTPLRDVPPPEPCFTLLPQKLDLELTAAAEPEQTPANATASRPSKLPQSAVGADQPRPSPLAAQVHLETLLKQFEQQLIEHSKCPLPTPATALPLRAHALSGPKTKLPRFSGQTSLEAFLAQFELAATEHGWSSVIKANESGSAYQLSQP
ncbi:UNVERIFIED_CONTAM: hypothetical protein FKN15_000128 [Acipenser sinensis]